MVRMDDKRVILEKGDKGYEESWSALIASGKNPNDWMYMYSEGSKAFFKNKLFRNYVSVVVEKGIPCGNMKQLDKVMGW